VLDDSDPEKLALDCSPSDRLNQMVEAELR
jgi:hypothetical protein